MIVNPKWYSRKSFTQQPIACCIFYGLKSRWRSSWLCWRDKGYPFCTLKNVNILHHLQWLRHNRMINKFTFAFIILVVLSMGWSLKVLKMVAVKRLIFAVLNNSHVYKGFCHKQYLFNLHTIFEFCLISTTVLR